MTLTKDPIIEAGAERNRLLRKLFADTIEFCRESTNLTRHPVMTH